MNIQEAFLRPEQLRAMFAKLASSRLAMKVGSKLASISPKTARYLLKGVYFLPVPGVNEVGYLGVTAPARIIRSKIGRKAIEKPLRLLMSKRIMTDKTAAGIAKRIRRGARGYEKYFGPPVSPEHAVAAIKKTGKFVTKRIPSESTLDKLGRTLLIGGY